MMIKAKIGHMEVSISEGAATVLGHLVELEQAGLIENGSTSIGVDPGYDAGSLEGQAAPVVTRRGEQFIQQTT